MTKPVLGYVKHKEHSEVIRAYVDFDENGYLLINKYNPKVTGWYSRSMWEELGEKEIVNDPIKPDHYHAGGIDVFTFLEANLSNEKVIGYHQGSAIKYIIRAGKKGPASEDYKKATVHVDKLKELSKGMS